MFKVLNSMVLRSDPALIYLNFKGSLFQYTLGKTVMKKTTILAALIQLMLASTSHAQELNNEMNNSLNLCPENDIYCQIIMREL
ncbi:hypothetical protein VISP3789_22173 [Vibrio splendidus ATCC 33789]|nr:hypothetical protein VISP3789_22173 [Vibrio splendidus ATCC 33789]